MIPLFLIFALILSSLTAIQPTSQEYIIAAKLEGEAGPLGLPGLIMVADTMIGRKMSDDFPDSWRLILPAYYGWATPSKEAVAIAIVANRDPWTPTGLKFVYSQTDIENLGLPPADLVVENHPFRLHFYRTFPLENNMTQQSEIPNGDPYLAKPVENVSPIFSEAIRRYLKLAGIKLADDAPLSNYHVLLYISEIG